jgi:hypothetical protein
MTDEPLDLRQLDPDRDPAWRERIVHAVMTSVRQTSRDAPSPRAIAGPNAGDVLSEMLGMTRPALAVACASVVLVILVSVGTERLGRRGRSEARAVQPYAVAEALGMPEPLAAWVEGSRAPTAAEVLSTLGGY